MYLVYFIAALAGGVLTGMAGLTAAMVLTPILCGVCGWNAYDAVTMSLIANVPSALATCYTFYKNGNIDMKRGGSVAAVSFTGAILGSWLGYLFSQVSENGVSYIVILGNLLLAVTFFLPKKKKEAPAKAQQRRTIIGLALAFLVGIECGFMGSAGGALMLMVLSMVLGMDTKLAVGTSSMVMTLVALTGAVSHVAMGASIDWIPAAVITLVCTIGALVSAKFANKVSEKMLNYSTGIVLILVSIISLVFS